MFYFNKQSIPYDELDGEQFSKVKLFKDKLLELGVLYHEYNGNEEFESEFKKHIQKLLLDKVEYTDNIKNGTIKSTDKLTELFTQRFKESLQTYSSQPIFWIDPVLSKSNEIVPNPDDDKDNIVNVSEICNYPKTLLIKAPPQFGQTSLSHYIIKEAYEKNRFIGLYLDADNFKSNAVDKTIQKELKLLEVGIDCIKFIILDSWSNYETDSLRILKRIADYYSNIPLIVMQRIDETKYNSPEEDVMIERKFEILHLLALPRGHVRKVVAAYNNEKQIGDEDRVLSKVVSDLDVLNIHRTPFNCITLLKVSEKYFDESPVNRTKMLEMVLFLLFNIDEIPTYKSKPDLKDCEYVLGRFCEMMIKEKKYSFSREYFIKELLSFCKEKLIDLEIELVFDILYKNNIIIKRDSDYVFRFTYWIFYFAAHRMHASKEFADFIFSEQKYVSYPEIIEFYTGIDRNREDALKILINDIKDACDIVDAKVGLPDDMNPFDFIKWNPSNEAIVNVQKEIGEDVQQSKLPVEVKDRFADQNYNQKKPYNQSVHNILNDYSVIVLMQKIQAASVALRNSDYVSPDVKRKLLHEIVRSWEQLSKVLIALTPLLASERHAIYEGVVFVLRGQWSDDIKKRFLEILIANPTNVVGNFKDYLFSNKMGPLLGDYLKKETNPLRRHILALFLILERPNGWKEQIEDYISSVHKNSFYLSDILKTIRSEYKYSFASKKELSEMKLLIKMSIAKHSLGIAKPGKDAIKKIPDKFIPNRDID
jgi:hypothetical protein